MNRANSGEVNYRSYALFALAAVAVVLVACSGSIGGTAPAAGTLPATGTVPAVAATNFPIGGTYNYAITQWGVWYNPGQSPAPWPTSHSSAQETIVTGASFDGRRDLIDVKTVLQYSGYLYRDDVYSTWVPASGGGASLEVVGDAWTDSGDDVGSGTIRYTTPQVEVRLPFLAGNRWNGGSASVEDSLVEVAYGKHALKSVWNQTTNLDGSYVMYAVNPVVIGPHNWYVHSRVESDGAAQYRATEVGTTPLVQNIGVPQRDASGTFVIPLATLNSQFTVRDWYPGGGLPPSPLSSTIETDGGMQQLPSVCNVPRSLATSAEAIEEVSSLLNPYGIIDRHRATFYYAPGVGMVCEIYDEQSHSYDLFLGRHVRKDTSNSIETVTALQSITHRSNGVASVDVGPELSYSTGPAIAAALRRQARNMERRSLLLQPVTDR